MTTIASTPTTTLRQRAAAALVVARAEEAAREAAREAAQRAEEQAIYETHVRKLTQFVLAYLTGTAEPDGLTLPTALPGQVQRHPLHDYQGAILTLDGLTFGYSSVRVYTFHLLDRCPTCGAWRTSNVPFRPGDLAQLGAFLEQPSWYGHPCRTEWTTTGDSEIPF